MDFVDDLLKVDRYQKDINYKSNKIRCGFYCFSDQLYELTNFRMVNYRYINFCNSKKMLQKYIKLFWLYFSKLYAIFVLYLICFL